MPVIKRYANRKLYDTESRRYVTLEEIADMVRLGDEVTIIDHVTGEDLTTLFLIQIMLAQERRAGGVLSGEFYAGLVRAGRQTATRLYESLSASLDLASYFTTELRHRFARLVEEGLLSAQEADRMRDLLLAVKPKATASEGSTVPSSPEVEAADPEEVAHLLQQIETLQAEIAAIEKPQVEPDTSGSD